MRHKLFALLALPSFLSFLQTQPALSPQFRKLLTQPQLSAKLEASENFSRFVEDMQHSAEIFVSPQAAYRIARPQWSAPSREIFDTDLRIVRYKDRSDFVMERVAVVDCNAALKFGMRPASLSGVPRDFLMALLYNAWQEQTTRHVPVRIFGKKLNSNAGLNQALSRMGFETVLPDKSQFLLTPNGQIDWPRSLEKMASQDTNVVLQLELGLVQ